MNRLFASIHIVRPLNMILSLCAVFIAGWLVNDITSPLLPYTALVVLCFAGASNILNDVLDINIDKINRPNRMLPSGHLKIQEALLNNKSITKISQSWQYKSMQFEKK